MKKSVWALSLLLTTLSAGAMAAKGTVTVYKSPTCGCCGQWAEGVEKAGYDVETNIIPQAQLEKMMLDSGATANLMSCHLATLNDKYVIGHVPADSLDAINTLPESAKGISVPGMPVGSLGMEYKDMKEPYDVIAYDADGKQTVFRSY